MPKNEVCAVCVAVDVISLTTRYSSQHNALPTLYCTDR